MYIIFIRVTRVPVLICSFLLCSFPLHQKCRYCHFGPDLFALIIYSHNFVLVFFFLYLSSNLYLHRVLSWPNYFYYVYF